MRFESNIKHHQLHKNPISSLSLYWILSRSLEYDYALVFVFVSNFRQKKSTINCTRIRYYTLVFVFVLNILSMSRKESDYVSGFWMFSAVVSTKLVISRNGRMVSGDTVIVKTPLLVWRLCTMLAKIACLCAKLCSPQYGVLNVLSCRFYQACYLT